MQKALHALVTTAGTRAFQQAATFVAAVTLAGALIMWLMLERTSEIVSRQVIETMTVANPRRLLTVG